MNTTRLFLTAGVAMPFIYFASLFGMGLLYPEYSHMTQVPSELGADNAPYGYAGIFNSGLMLVGLASIEGAIGLFMVFREKGMTLALPLLTALTLFSFGLSFVIFGLVPLPNPMHNDVSILTLPGIFTPLLGALAVRSIAKQDIAWKVILLGFFASFSVILILLGVGDLVTEENVGLWVRIQAFISFPILGYLCWTAMRLNKA